MVVTQNLIKGIKYTDMLDKERLHRDTVLNVLNRLTTIFKYTTDYDIDTNLMELMLLTQGSIIISKSKEGIIMPYNNVYAQGECNGYYIPTQFNKVNPWTKDNETTCTIGVDGVLGLNDTNGVGVMPHLNKMSTLITECIISMYDALINSRMQTIISAVDDNTLKSATKYINDVKRGELAIIGTKDILDENSLGVHPTNVGNNNITELLEMYNTLNAMLYSEYGLNCSTNVKREYVNDSETGNNHTLLCNMYECRVKLCEDLNTLYNLGISVTINPMVNIDMFTNEETNEDEDTNEDETPNDEEVDNEELPNEDRG